ncbi:MAG TPA: hypothetical protein DHU93_03175 [Algoriphagus sp.]|nr:hypothetical protein [Algoriphagus sp.]
MFSIFPMRFKKMLAAAQRRKAYFLPQRIEEAKKFLKELSNRAVGSLEFLFKFIATIKTRLWRFK